MNRFWWPPKFTFGLSFYIGPLSYSRYWGFYINSIGPIWSFEYEWKVRNHDPKKNKL